MHILVAFFASIALIGSLSAPLSASALTEQERTTLLELTQKVLGLQQKIAASADNPITATNECTAATYPLLSECIRSASVRSPDTELFTILLTNDIVLQSGQVIRLRGLKNVVMRGAGGVLKDQPVTISESSARMASDAADDRYMIEVVTGSSDVTISNLTLTDATSSESILRQKCRAGAHPDPAFYALWDPPFCYAPLLIGGVSALTSDVVTNITVDKLHIVSHKAMLFEVKRTIGLTVLDSVFDGAGVHGIFFNSAYSHVRTVFRTNHFMHAGTAALNLHNVDDVLVEANTFVDNHIDPQFMYCSGGGTPPSCSGGTVKYYPGGQLYAADVVNAPVNNVRFINNDLSMTAQYLGKQTTTGIEVTNGQHAPMTNVLVQGNRVTNMSRDAIAIHNATTSLLGQRNILVKDNQIFDAFFDFPFLNLPATSFIQLETNPVYFPNNLHPYVDFDANLLRKGSGPGMSATFEGTPKTCVIDPVRRLCPAVEIRWQLTGAPTTSKPIIKANGANMKGYAAGTMSGTTSAPWIQARNYWFALHLDATDPYPIAVINITGTTAQ